MNKDNIYYAIDGTRFSSIIECNYHNQKIKEKEKRKEKNEKDKKK